MSLLLGALTIGLILSILGFVSPSGLAVGSLRWQPVFFSTIALTLGLQAFLLGIILTRQSIAVSSQTRERFRYVGTRRFPTLCIAAGGAALLAGLMLDAPESAD